MPTHLKASIGSRSLCDRLQVELKKSLVDMSVSRSKDTCGLYQTGHNRFAYIYHRSDASLIRVYFRGDPVVQPSDPTGQLAIHIRPRIEKGWDKEFPFFLILEETSNIQVAANILREFSCPLAVRRTKRKTVDASNRDDICIPEEIPEGTLLLEGSTRQIQINVYERNPTARLLCIQHYGAKCFICKFDFQSNYGERGKGFIHVHHTKALSEIKAQYHVDPIADLRPVCPNCHAMIHRTTLPSTCEEIKKIIEQNA